MKRTSVLWATFACFGSAAAAAHGCGASDVPVARENANLNGNLVDAGSGLCGAQACASGELCCAGADEQCSPTCMNVAQCPAYGRPCKVPVDGTADGGTIDAPTAALNWYWTCGGPVCGEPDASALSPVCPQAGSPCTTKGETCGDGATTCGSVMVCDDHDPKAMGCPKSSAKFKENIHYLNEGDLVSLHDETLGMRLASYKYRAPWADGSTATHLGFIIEDQPQSLSVERGHDRVDMYGYLSMVVATMQVQDKQIQKLEKELSSLRSTCEKK